MKLREISDARLLIILVVSSMIGCGAHTASIKSLLDDPASHDGKTVRITGEVTENVGALGYGAYRVDDGTGTITVLTKMGGAPRKGATVDVKGQFESAFTLGSTSLAVIQEKSRKAAEE